MRLRYCLPIAALVAINLAVLVSGVHADNYGGVSVSTRQSMQAQIHRAFDRYGVGSTMVCIANRESGFNPRAANWHDSNGGSFGLLQINGAHMRRGEWVGSRSNPGSFPRRMWIPWQNIAVAVSLYRSSGLRPWGGGC